MRDKITNYDQIAHEYYNSSRHPTCANFDMLSRRFLEPKIFGLSDAVKKTIDVGAGRSVLASVLARVRSRLDDCVLLDSSPGMLEYSREWEKLGASLMIADITNTGLPQSEFQLLVASLGDPYNTEDFWAEAHRLLSDGGTCLFTTPTPEWAHRFRPPSQKTNAQFDLANNQSILVPSHIPRPEDQIAMIQRSGFRISEVQSYSSSDVAGPLSSKLVIGGEGVAQIPLLRGFEAIKLA
jgi:SAM-dependent methyltransferase